MILEQYYLGCLAHASYLIGDAETGIAAVVDPRRDVDGYIEDAVRLGLTIKHVFLTHFHADFLAGHLELRDKVGTQIHLGAQADADYAFVPMADGSTVEMGSVRLQVLETPGHTPEGICVLVYDLAVDAEKPHAVLTGDTLFIGDVGRPDLMASIGVSADDLAGMMYDSLRSKLLPLADETLVYPGHGAGSLCGKNLSTDTVSTIGVQRLFNYALQPMSKRKFILVITQDQPQMPQFSAYDAALNKRERPTLDQTIERGMVPLTLDELLEQQAAGAQVLDVRDPADYEGAYMAGAISIGIAGSFAPWAGVVLDQTRPVVVIADPGLEVEVAVRLGRIGFDNMAGYFDGGMQSLASRPDLVLRTERITVLTLAEQLASTDVPAVLDVRAAGEWGNRHIAGSVNVPPTFLKDMMGEVPDGRPLIV
jgi:hydroxyacylglutathione hydrolase